MTWTFQANETGNQDVQARWTAHPNRATNATYTVTHDGGSTAVTVDQQGNSGTFQTLGSFAFTQGQDYTISVTDQADGYVIADAIQVLPPGAGPNRVVWQPGIDGEVEVFAKWTSHANRASNAPYTINHVNGSDTVTVNQQQQGGTFVSLGTYTLDASSTITLTDEADGYVIADANQLVVWDAVYQPFGQATLPTELITYNPRFPGQYFDAETGLHYNYFRDYEPSTGRYVESDPIGLRGGVNTYAYVKNNSIKFIDRNGLILDDLKNYLRKLTSEAIGEEAVKLPGYGRGIECVNNLTCSASTNPQLASLIHDECYGLLKAGQREAYLTCVATCKKKLQECMVGCPSIPAGPGNPSA